MDKYKIRSLFLIVSFFLQSNFASAMEGEREEYRPYYHTHREYDGTRPSYPEIIRRRNCDLLAVYISSEAKISYQGERLEEEIIQKDQDSQILGQIFFNDNINHLLIGFKIGFRKNKTAKLEWKHLRLLYNYPNPTLQSPNNLKGNFTVGEKEDPNNSVFLADFYNHAKELHSPESNENRIHIHPITDNINDFQNGTHTTCTPNRGGGYHSEGVALSYLYNNGELFRKLINNVRGNEVTSSVLIECCIMKLYSSKDICTNCQRMLFESKESIEETFNTQLEASRAKDLEKGKIPMIIVGLSLNLYDDNFWVKKDSDNKECTFINLKSDVDSASFFNRLIYLDPQAFQPLFLWNMSMP